MMLMWFLVRQIVLHEFSEHCDMFEGVPESVFFIPNQFASSWTRDDDRILLRATYYYGFAKYEAMKADRIPFSV